MLSQQCLKQVALQDNSSPCFHKMMWSWADNQGVRRTTGLCVDLVIMNERISPCQRPVCIWRGMGHLVTFTRSSGLQFSAFTLSGLVRRMRGIFSISIIVSSWTFTVTPEFTMAGTTWFSEHQDNWSSSLIKVFQPADPCTQNISVCFSHHSVRNQQPINSPSGTNNQAMAKVTEITVFPILMVDVNITRICWPCIYMILFIANIFSFSNALIQSRRVSLHLWFCIYSGTKQWKIDH